MEDSQTLVQFYQLKRELHEASQQISQLAVDNFGKKVLLKKDYISLLDLMRETVATARVTIGFLRLIFKLDQDRCLIMSQGNELNSDQGNMANMLEEDASLKGVFLAPVNHVPENNVAEVRDSEPSEISAQNANLDSCYTVGSYEVSPKNILDLASDRGFEDINCEGSLLDPSLMESSLLESSQDHSNVSIRRKRKNFLGSSVEDSFEDIDRATLDLIQSGKIDISQICQEKENMSFSDVCRLNVAIFDPVLRASGQSADWADWRDVSCSQDFLKSVPESSTPSLKTEADNELDSSDLRYSFSSKSVNIRDSVITPKCKKRIEEAETPASEIISPAALFKSPVEPSTPAALLNSLADTPTLASEINSPAALLQPPVVTPTTTAGLCLTPIKYDRDTKEIDQKESPKLVVLFDTRLSSVVAPDDEEEPEAEDQPEAEDKPGLTDQPKDLRELDQPEQSNFTDKEVISPIQVVLDTALPQPDGSPLLKHTKTFLNESSQSLHKHISNSTLIESAPETADDLPSELVAGENLKSSLRRGTTSCSKSVRFFDLTTYYFTRRQGWLAVPKEGGNTLGMEYYHKHMETFSLEIEEVKAEVMAEGAMVKAESAMVKLECENVKAEGDVKVEDGSQPGAIYSNSDRPCKMARLCMEPDWMSTVEPVKEFNEPVWKSTMMESNEPVWKNTMKDSNEPVWKSTVKDSNEPVWKNTMKESNEPVWKSTVKDSNEPVWKSTVKEPGILKLTRLVEPAHASSSMLLNWSTDADFSPNRPRKNRTSGRRGLKGSVSSSLLSSTAPPLPPPPRKGECGTRGLDPLSSRARKSLLKAEGVRFIDPAEAIENKFIRQYRNQCGCSCTQQCLPGSCECVDGGIQCSEERSGFPCSCSATCTNPHGIKRFDPTNVKMHFIQTMLDVQGSLDIK